ncbi:MaoC/PaaZ C-terminal domain-containing protein [Actinoplanes sp. NPDC026619]|uniref:MaoC family dehydratase n=1 Tax=Actinoplanes sp. NPDC026619 TaxID=3155798 RepID=UPI0033FF52EF
MAVVEVTAEPSGLYLRAALGLLPGRRPAGLPDLSLLRRGVPVDRDHLARYNRVCGFRLGDTLPPTYPHILAFPLAMRLMSAGDFPFPVVGVVHIANRITVSRPIDAGEVLDLTVWCEDLRPHDRGQQFDVHASAAIGDEIVWSGVSTYLSKSGAKGAKRDQPLPPAPTARWRVPANIGARYADVSGDRNPIHTSRIGARVFGFPRPIAHGMWSKARSLAALEGRLPAQYTVDVAFKQPILLPSTVGFTASAANDGWEFRVDGKRPHLAGVVTPP